MDYVLAALALAAIVGCVLGVLFLKKRYHTEPSKTPAYLEQQAIKAAADKLKAKP